MVATESIRQGLEQRGFRNIRHWSRGVDTDLFRPRPKEFLNHLRPIMLYVGRVSVEKNLEAFLDLDLPGTKLIVGDGPARCELQQRYPHARFAGMRQGAELAQYYAASDVFVFPSKSDTFGLVMLESMASGLPVAAFPVEGPADVVGQSGAGVLDNDLARAIRKALQIEPTVCVNHARRYGWRSCALEFLENLQPLEADRGEHEVGSGAKARDHAELKGPMVVVAK